MMTGGWAYFKMFKVFASGMSSGELMPVRFRNWAGMEALS